jgi:hypothetical protein
MSRNLAASIRARLKQRANVTKQDFNLTLTHYGLERLLYRLSISPHSSNYLLKGALLFSLWYDQPHRPTRDADLLGLVRTTSIPPYRHSAKSPKFWWTTASLSTPYRSRVR